MKTTTVFLVLAFVFLPAAAHAFEAKDFSGPYGITVDAKHNYLYVSNVNGNPNSRDGNGFISRLKGDGTVDDMRFIDGAKRGITLHAPKGMEIIAERLYVTDIDALRVFDLEKKKPLYDINFGELPVQHLYDIAIGPDGALYVTDGPGNAIYRIDPERQHEVTPFVTGAMLGQPHGIAWASGRQLFVVASWSAGQVIALDRSGKQQPMPGVFLSTVEGAATDDAGNAYVGSTALGAVFRVAPNFALFDFALGISSPAGVAFHRAEKSILIASFDTGVVSSVAITPPQAPKKPAVPAE